MKVNTHEAGGKRYFHARKHLQCPHIGVCQENPDTYSTFSKTPLPTYLFVKFPIPGCGLAAFVGLSLPIPEAIGLALARDKTLHMPQNFCWQGI